MIIPDSVTEIGTSAFSGCGLLNGKLVLGKNIVKIEPAAFNNCYNLKGDIIVPSSTTNIDSWAFTGCGLIESIKILNKNTEINSVPPNAIIKGYIGSTAQQYANDNGKTFVEIPE